MVLIPLAPGADSGAGRPHLERRVGRAFAEDRFKTLAVGLPVHLSQDNNTPAVALRTHRRIVGGRLPLVVAGRHEASDVLEV